MKQIIFTIAIHPFLLKIDQTPAIRACLTTLMAGIDFYVADQRGGVVVLMKWDEGEMGPLLKAYR